MKMNFIYRIEEKKYFYICAKYQMIRKGILNRTKATHSNNLNKDFFPSSSCSHLSSFHQNFTRMEKLHIDRDIFISDPKNYIFFAIICEYVTMYSILKTYWFFKDLNTELLKVRHIRLFKCFCF